MDKAPLSPGKLADLAILGQDVFAVLPERIPEVEVVTTAVRARVVFESGR